MTPNRSSDSGAAMRAFEAAMIPLFLFYILVGFLDIAFLPKAKRAASALLRFRREHERKRSP